MSSSSIQLRMAAVARWFWPQGPELDARTVDRQRRAGHIARALYVSSQSIKRGPDGIRGSHSLALIESLRNTIFWTLRAMNPRVDAAETLAHAMEQMRSECEHAAGGAAEYVHLQTLLSTTTTSQLEALDETTLLVENTRVAVFADRLVRTMDERLGETRAMWNLRLTRVGMIVGLVLMVVLGWPALRRRFKPELARKAHWTASSQTEAYALTGVGYHPFEGQANIFFHTQPEASPWIEFDLGSSRDVESVWVQNRLDCCQERAKPLIIETSLDHVRWTEAARNKEIFYYWTANFKPRSARWVRLRVGAPSMLHLGAVEIR